MIDPPPYPRVPHVSASSAATSDDRLLAPRELDALLGTEVVVEEKLDGMGIMLWLSGQVVDVGTRGGAGTVDRSGERGRIRAWAARHSDLIGSVLGETRTLYGEWLRRHHAVTYDRLPSVFVGFDVLDRSSGAFLVPADRDVLLAEMGVCAPPVCFRGILGSLDHLFALLGKSAYGTDQAEGLVVRTADGADPRVAKFVDPRWQGIGTFPWAGENTGWRDVSGRA